MGKRGGARKAQTSATNNNVTLREETTGKMQTKRGSSNAKHMLKVEHLERLAVWAGGEASMPSLGAFFGRKLASVGESLGVPRNTSLFLCHRFVSLRAFFNKVFELKYAKMHFRVAGVHYLGVTPK